MLTERGHIAEHVNDIGLGDGADLTLWTYAIEYGAVLVTKDEDFRDLLLLRGSPPAAPGFVPGMRGAKRSSSDSRH